MHIQSLIAFSLLAAVIPAQAGEAKPDSKPAAPGAKAPGKTMPNPVVLMSTSMGDITLELFVNAAPKTVANFCGLAEGTKEFTDPKTGKKVKRPFYDGLIFHRVIPNFMAQGGCPLGTGTGSPGYKFEDEINAKSLGLDKIMAWKDGSPNSLLGIRSRQQFQQVLLGPLFKKLKITSQKDLDAKRKEFDAALAKVTLLDAFKGMGYAYSETLNSHKMSRGTLAMANSGPNTNGSQFFINMKDNSYLNGKHTVFGQVKKGLEIVDAMAKVEKTGDKPKKEIVIKSMRVVSGKLPPGFAQSPPTAKPVSKPTSKPAKKK